ncbi:hypothetical protein Pmani_001499 [Petrolisthes manimaculis]|uniref:Uncharacterized protein n=1 Tax=Petrolisthes manimaculis TaxID=1843537 RepID=A0AAE1UPC4_9EUCA|nr:hypothetical protein Pmani_001499 [Petrolisthes manimaculis]
MRKGRQLQETKPTPLYSSTHNSSMHFVAEFENAEQFVKNFGGRLCRYPKSTCDLRFLGQQEICHQQMVKLLDILEHYCTSFLGSTYGTLMEEDNCEDDFCEEDINQILSRRTTVIQHESEKGGVAGVVEVTGEAAPPGPQAGWLRKRP